MPHSTSSSVATALADFTESTVTALTQLRTALEVNFLDRPPLETSVKWLSVLRILETVDLLTPISELICLHDYPFLREATALLKNTLEIRGIMNYDYC